MKVEVGTKLRLVKAQGPKTVVTQEDGTDAIHWDNSEEAGHLPADSIGTVVAIIPADVNGVGDNTREHVAIHFGPEEPHGAAGQRIWSYPTEELDAVFEAEHKKTPHRYGAFVKEVK